MRDVFIIGARGLPANYGGFETFVKALVDYQIDHSIQYHAANLSEAEQGTHYTYKGADVFNIKKKHAGAASVIFYDCDALNYALRYIKSHAINEPVIYILGNTIGALIPYYAQKIHAAGGRLLVNPDGLEWKRSKWSAPVRAYLKYAEKQMVRYADVVVADNEGIDGYLQQKYGEVRSVVIPYGTTHPPAIEDDRAPDWLNKHEVSSAGYYLMVGRFVPENNYKAVIREFMKTDTTRDLLIITDYAGNGLYDSLKHDTCFTCDSRIKFVGPLYDASLLGALRQQAFAYIHGHEVGGTNPSLLEAMASTRLNLVYDVSFNQTVARNSALYWKKDELAQLIQRAEALPDTEVAAYASAARALIALHYTWPQIVAAYEELFCEG